MFLSLKYALQIFCKNSCNSCNKIRSELKCSKCCKKERHQSRPDVELENNSNVQIEENGHRNGILDMNDKDLTENENGQTTSTPNRAETNNLPIITY